MKKKSQIFLFDGIIGFTIVLIALGVILTYYSSTTENVDIYSLNQQVLNSFTNTKINQLNDVEIRAYFRAGKIKNIHNTVAQQIAEYYYEGKYPYAINLTEIFVEDFITKQMNAKILIFNQTTENSPFELFNETNRNIPLEDATITATTKRSVMGFVDPRTPYGPYTIEIIIWQ